MGSSTLCSAFAVGTNVDLPCSPGALPGGTGQVVTATSGTAVTATAPATVTVEARAALDLASAAPGGTVRPTARGLLAGRPVELYVGGVLLESRTAPSDGTWARSFIVPPGTPAGPLEFEFRQQDVPPVRVTLTVLP